MNRLAYDDAGGNPDPKALPRKRRVQRGQWIVGSADGLGKRVDEVVPPRLGRRHLEHVERLCAKAPDALAIEQHELPRRVAERSVGEQGVRRGDGVGADRARI